MKPYQHLVKEERFYIWQALRDGKSQQEVAIAFTKSRVRSFRITFLMFVDTGVAPFLFINDKRNTLSFL